MDKGSSKLYERAIEKMSFNRDKAINGGVNSIPSSFERFSRYWNGVEKGKYYIVTASSGVGKSKLAKKLFVFDLVDKIIENPDWGIDLHIKYYCLEESKVNFIQSLMSYKMYYKDRQRTSVTQMNSIGDIVSEKTISTAKEWSSYWEKFEQMVEVVDDIRHPTGIFKHTEDWLLKNGEWTMTQREFTDNETGEVYTKEVKDYYIPNHPDRYVGVIVDHISLISTEKGDGVSMNLHQSISKLSSNYFLQLRDNYNCFVVNVQQQMAAQEQQQFTYKGQSIESKLEPTMNGLADNKLTARDADVIFGLFAPDRYEIPKHANYDVAKLQDHYRSLKILKFRDGISNVKLGVFFDGAVGCFEELSPSQEMEAEDYEIYLGRVGLLNS
jgi:replicative DNA helicase